MADAEQPQIYLISPPEFDLGTYPEVLKAVLDAREIACVRLALASRDGAMVATALARIWVRTLSARARRRERISVRLASKRTARARVARRSPNRPLGLR